jgi:hypothetical protein
MKGPPNERLFNLLAETIPHTIRTTLPERYVRTVQYMILHAVIYYYVNSLNE